MFLKYGYLLWILLVESFGWLLCCDIASMIVYRVERSYPVEV